MMVVLMRRNTLSVRRGRLGVFPTGVAMRLLEQGMAVPPPPWDG
ncbi:MAG: hypothetical protein ACOYOQ_00025 [Microthrixaceae bacterium]